MNDPASAGPTQTATVDSAHLVPTAALAARAAELRAQYIAAQPFPFVALQDLWDDAVLARVDDEFPGPGERDWLHWDTAEESKETSDGVRGLSPFIQTVLRQLNSDPFLEVVRSVTGLDDLVADDTYFGAGLHEAFRGGWLNVHGDWTRHPDKPLARRVNLLTYLNRDWEPDWGGDLELWDEKTGKCAVRVPPVFNRTVIFNTTPDALHGFPRPLTCPLGRSRRLISVYYWSADPELLEKVEHIKWMADRRADESRGGLSGLVRAGKRLLGRMPGRRKRPGPTP